MTTLSETRAGKLPELPDSPFWNLQNEPFFTADQMRAYALEALAASEPDMRDAYEGAREDFLDWKGRAQRAEARLRALGWTGIDASTHPAPEQPGKGDPNGQHCPNCRFTMSGLGYCVNCKWSAPQPSDPAEGDAYDPMLPEHEAEVDAALGMAKITMRLPIDVLGEIDHRAAQEGIIRVAKIRMLLAEALSTPPTAAVRIDAADLLFVGFDKNSEHRLFRMRETAERHCIGEIKTYAALDPQVKR